MVFLFQLIFLMVEDNIVDIKNQASQKLIPASVLDSTLV